MSYSSVEKSDSIIDNINNEYYSSPVHPYVNRPMRPCIEVKTTSDAERLLSLMKEYEEELNEYEKNKSLHYDDIASLEYEFHEDLKREFGLECNPKEQALYDIAYSHGHSGGFWEVYNFYSELSELII